VGIPLFILFFADGQGDRPLLPSVATPTTPPIFSPLILFFSLGAKLLNNSPRRRAFHFALIFQSSKAFRVLLVFRPLLILFLDDFIFFDVLFQPFNFFPSVFVRWSHIPPVESTSFLVLLYALTIILRPLRFPRPFLLFCVVLFFFFFFGPFSASWVIAVPLQAWLPPLVGHFFLSLGVQLSCCHFVIRGCRWCAASTVLRSSA